MSKKNEPVLTTDRPEYELTWLKKDERVLYYDNALDIDSFSTVLSDALKADGIAAEISEQEYSVDGVKEEGRCFKITPEGGDHGQNCYVSISEVGRYRTIKHATYIDPPALPGRPGKQKAPGGSGILENLKSAIIGLALLVAGLALHDINDLELARDVDLPMTSKVLHIPLPTIDFEPLRTCGLIILGIGLILLLFGAGSIILNAARRSMNVKVSHDEKIWNDAWKKWSDDTLIPAYRDSRVYDAIYEATLLACGTIFRTQPLRIRETVNKLSDLQSIASNYQSERK